MSRDRDLAADRGVYRVLARYITDAGERPYGCRVEPGWVVFTLQRLDPGEGWSKFGGWPSAAFDDRDVASVEAVVADEHRLRREAGLVRGSYRIKWVVIGEPPRRHL